MVTPVTEDNAFELPSDGASNAGESINTNFEKIDAGHTFKLVCAVDVSEAEVVRIDSDGEWALAIASSTDNSIAVGFITEDGAAGAERHGRHYGRITNSNWSFPNNGVLVYLSATVAGAVTVTEPAAPNKSVPLGVVVATDTIFALITQFRFSPADGTQAVYKTIDGNTGSTTANSPDDSLDIKGGTSPTNIISTVTTDVATLTLTDQLRIGADQDKVQVFGRWKMGFDGTNIDEGVLWHFDLTATTQYAIRVKESGVDSETWINAANEVVIARNNVRLVRFQQGALLFVDYDIDLDDSDIDNARFVNVQILDNYGNGINVSDTISFINSARINWNKITAASVTLSAGTSANTVTDLQTANDGNTYAITEAAATPGITLIVDFNSVNAINWVEILATYDGAATHALEIELYNWTGTSWDHFGCSQNSESNSGTIFCNASFFVPDDTNYIGTGGNAGKVRIRFNHPMAGNAAHDFYIDIAALHQ